MEIELIKTLLNHEAYQSSQAKLRQSIFSEDGADLYVLLKDAHKYESDLKPEDLYSIWLSKNPVATTSEINEFRDNIDDLKRAEAITPEVAGDVIESLWRREMEMLQTSVSTCLKAIPLPF